MPGGLEDLLADFEAHLAEPPACGREEDHRRLSRLLDRLASARGGCPSAAHPEGTVPRAGEGHRRSRLAARFPELGYYATVDPLEVPAEQPTADDAIGDAIGDLMDIQGALLTVARHLVHGGPEEAARYFAWSHDVHWGRHLRELQLYLHALGE